jgi:hypothetical protein
MPLSAFSCVRELNSLKREFDDDALGRKLELLKHLERRRLKTATAVVQFHDILCFMRAWPNGSEILKITERILEGFAKRNDLRRFQIQLEGSGIAGTDISYRFFHPTAEWLAERWGDRLQIDWPKFENAASLENFLSIFGSYAETPALDEYDFGARVWIDRMKNPGETDAVFLIRSFRALHADSFLREKLYEDLDPPLRLLSGADTPSCSTEKFPVKRIIWQKEPIQNQRLDLKATLRSSSFKWHILGTRQARRAIDLTRGTMVTRLRDLDAFAYADPNDVRIANCGGGVQVVMMGVLPERRLLLESLYGYLLLKNGVPIGYGTGVGLFSSCEVAFNLFPAFRGSETALLYTLVLAVFRQLFDADTFMVDTYQLGHDNEEALHSGAWWFYANLGFMPRDPAALRLARSEMSRRKKRAGYRSSISALKSLSQYPVFLELMRKRHDVLGTLNLPAVGLAVTDLMARRFGSDRKGGARLCAVEVAHLLKAGSLKNVTAAERDAWEWWSPLVLVLGSVHRWPRKDQRALVEVIRAKGGRHESDFVPLFDGHQRLRKAVQRLAENG